MLLHLPCHPCKDTRSLPNKNLLGKRAGGERGEGEGEWEEGEVLAAW